MMEEAIAFINEFIANEYAAWQAYYLEQDDELFEEVRDKVDRMYGADLMTEVNYRSIYESWFTEGEAKLAQVKPRILFQIKEYEHTDYGSLFRCYVSSYSNWSDSYSASFYIAKRENFRTKEKEWRIVSKYNNDVGNWQWRGGIRVEPLGKLLSVRQFQPPADPVDLADYEAALNSVVAPTETKTAPTPVSLDREKGENPQRDAFVETFGAIEEKVLWGKQYAGTPSQDPNWSIFLTLLGGKFYTSGFFRQGADPLSDTLPWPALGEAIRFTQELAQLLTEAGCTALNSEGDMAYFPFVYCGEMIDGLPDFIALGQFLEGAKLRMKRIQKRNCIFWDQQADEEYKEYLSPQTFEAFEQVSQKMKATLKSLVEISLVYEPAFPVVMGGTFQPGIFAGLVTLMIRR
ncbi:hypothetical protein [Xanthocytophaga flava]|uniref:hypothetical protein n=1 Tax=Xanthocytophaga flava TaxID=3048013 RepID=UPI0028D2006C|nr:hypothetical protein [Xanthocytophaga flavus]MDJ1471056.1 hypothetical protein [Xanthocytophaga flavus]